jgi:hypothetical protein
VNQLHYSIYKPNVWFRSKKEIRFMFYILYGLARGSRSAVLETRLNVTICNFCDLQKLAKLIMSVKV